MRPELSNDVGGAHGGYVKFSVSYMAVWVKQMINKQTGSRMHIGQDPGCTLARIQDAHWPRSRMHIGQDPGCTLAKIRDAHWPGSRMHIVQDPGCTLAKIQDAHWPRSRMHIGQDPGCTLAKIQDAHWPRSRMHIGQDPGCTLAKVQCIPVPACSSLNAPPPPAPLHPFLLKMSVWPSEARRQGFSLVLWFPSLLHQSMVSANRNKGKIKCDFNSCQT